MPRRDPKKYRGDGKMKNPECTIHENKYGMIDIGNHGVSDYVCLECIEAMKEVTRLARIVATGKNNIVVEWIDRLKKACEEVGEVENENQS
jgi:hypothetical protein